MRGAASFSVLDLAATSLLGHGSVLGETTSVVSAFALGGHAAAASRTEAIHHPGGETRIPAAGSLASPVPCVPPSHSRPALPAPLPGVVFKAEYLFVEGSV